MASIEKNKQIPQKRVIEPLVNIEETEKDVILEAEMPDLNKQDIDIEINGNELWIRASSSNEREAMPKEYTAIYRERCPLEYARTFVLGDEILKDKIEAQYETGILTIRLAKSETAQPKKITIKE
jgi:HSP20 family protein